MKFRRFISGLLFGLGCALSFIGLMAIVLPAIQNPQLQLVLAGFEMPSRQPVVEGINRLMRFILAQNWRVLYLGLFIAGAGAMLFLRFTPKTEVIKEPEPPQPAPQPVQPEPTEKPNPYAKITYHQPCMPEHTPHSFHPEPILERNTIDCPEPKPEFTADMQPYFSPRFGVESHVVETETGAWSQSGSRILIRSVPEPSAESAPEPAPEIALPAEEPVPPAPVARPSSLMTSPRIRSTMGRHTH